MTLVASARLKVIFLVEGYDEVDGSRGGCCWAMFVVIEIRYRVLHNSVNTQFIFSRVTWTFPQPNKADKMVLRLTDEPIPPPALNR
jgi:hypothetical protein